LWDIEVEPKANTSAAEWPTLQDAMNNQPTMSKASREEDDAWGGKMWDGVTDWF